MSSEITGDFGTLRAETEQIDVTSSSPYPDERWTFTDAQGHEHRYERVAVGEYYPTLVWIIDETYWCEDCHDEHTKGHYECRICGQEIEPGLTGPDMFRRYIPGLTSYYLNDEPISRERFEELRTRPPQD